MKGESWTWGLRGQKTLEIGQLLMERVGLGVCGDKTLEIGLLLMKGES